MPQPWSVNRSTQQSLVLFPESATIGTPRVLRYDNQGNGIWECLPDNITVLNATQHNKVTVDRRNGYKQVPYDPRNNTPLPYYRLSLKAESPITRGYISVTDTNSGYPIVCKSYTGQHTFGTWDGADYADTRSMTATRLIEELRNSAILGTNGKFADKKAITVDWASAIAEGGATINMFTNLVVRVSNTINYLRKANFKKAFVAMFHGTPHFSKANLHKAVLSAEAKRRRARMADKVSGTFLEWSFGWAPTLDDIYNGLKDIEGRPAPMIIKVKSTRRKKHHEKIQRSRTFSFTTRVDIPIRYQLDRLTDVKVGVSLSYKAEPVLSDLAGSGITNPGLAIWNATRLSFLFDWFVSVGSYLEYTFGRVGVQFLHGSVSSLVNVRENCNQPVNEFGKASSNIVRFTGRVSQDCAAAEFTREVLSSPPTARIAVVDDPLNLKRTLLSTALLQQFWSGHSKNLNLRAY